MLVFWGCNLQEVNVEDLIYEIVKADEEARKTLDEHVRKRDNIASEVAALKHDLEDTIIKAAQLEIQEYKAALDKDLDIHKLKLELQYENFKNVLDRQYYKNEDQWIASIFEKCIR